MGMRGQQQMRLFEMSIWTTSAARQVGITFNSS